MMRYEILVAIVVGSSLGAAVSAWAVGSRDKYSVLVPNGLQLNDFRGYEDWTVVSVSQTDGLLGVIVANPIMIQAFRAGVPGDGKPFPDGSKIAKIHWKMTKSADAPTPTTVPGALTDVDFMERDRKRYADTGGWGYSQIDYSSATDTFAPQSSSGHSCGYGCHARAAAKNYIFTAYQKR